MTTLDIKRLDDGDYSPQEIAELFAQFQWQPIETAPKDGTPLLGFDGGDHFQIKWEIDLEGWSSACGQPVVFTPEPTHWQRLPERPFN